MGGTPPLAAPVGLPNAIPLAPGARSGARFGARSGVGSGDWPGDPPSAVGPARGSHVELPAHSTEAPSTAPLDGRLLAPHEAALLTSPGPSLLAPLGVGAASADLASAAPADRARLPEVPAQLLDLGGVALQERGGGARPAPGEEPDPVSLGAAPAHADAPPSVSALLAAAASLLAANTTRAEASSESVAGLSSPAFGHLRPAPAARSAQGAAPTPLTRAPLAGPRPTRAGADTVLPFPRPSPAGLGHAAVRAVDGRTLVDGAGIPLATVRPPRPPPPAPAPEEPRGASWEAPVSAHAPAAAVTPTPVPAATPPGPAAAPAGRGVHELAEQEMVALLRALSRRSPDVEGLLDRIARELDTRRRTDRGRRIA